jgi:hypothetical protein
MSFAIASLLLALGALPLLVMSSSRQRYGPEGPVGAHMVTGPLALLISVAVWIGVAGGSCDPSGLPRWTVYLSLPGVIISLTIASIMAGTRSESALGRLGVYGTLVGALLALHGQRIGDGRLGSQAGMVLLWLSALASYGTLAAMWWAGVRRRSAAMASAMTRQAEFDREQVIHQREEWSKLPTEPALWQLIQFVHSVAPEVREACLQKIASMPNLNDAMRSLLQTGWADHSLRYLAQDYPISTAELADDLSTHLRKEAERWKSVLDPKCNPGSWYFNLRPAIEAAERVAKDGGDVRDAMRAWAELLHRMPGLQDLRQRALRLA